jgi:hypothetical protein
MEEMEDPLKLQRKIEQVSRIASRVNDPTTYHRLNAWVGELRQKLKNRIDAMRSGEQIRRRANELWEQHGRPEGRDVEFWLQAEAEVREENKGPSA